jgi:hypothetical protein
MDSMEPDDLNAAERRLWEAFPYGRVVDLMDPDDSDPADGANWGEERTVRASVIVALLLGAAEPRPGYVPAIRLSGARITGRVDLLGGDFDYPFIVGSCWFDGRPRFVEATTRTIRIVRSHLPGLSCARLRLSGILNLSESTIAGPFTLDHAQINGEFHLTGASIGWDPGTRALSAEGLTVTGQMKCDDGFRSNGSMLLRGARIGGRLDFVRAEVTCSGQWASLMVENAQIDGAFCLSESTVTNIGGVAVGAGGLIVAGGGWCNRGFTADGEVRFVGARFLTNLNLEDARLGNPGGIALNLNLASVGTLSGDRLTVSAGGVSMRNTQVTGSLSLRDARISSGSDEPVLDADGASMDSLFLTGLQAEGEVRIRSAKIVSRILLTGARLVNPGGIALRLSLTEIGADVFLFDAIVDGTLSVRESIVGRRLNLERATLSEPGGIALDGRGLRAGQLIMAPDFTLKGSVELGHARLGRILDSPTSWPDQLRLDGLVYESLEPPLTPEVRLGWLTRDPSGFLPQPYEQLASHYAQLGQVADAQTVMLAKERHQRRTKAPLARVWGGLQDVTVAYGYRPLRAGLWLALLLAIGATVFAHSPPAALKADEAPHFNPVIYVLDLLLPIVDLGQERAFNPAGADQWLSYVLVAAGWVLATTVAAGAARVVSRR